MGVKSRALFCPSFCMRTDCRNRDRRCDACIRFEKYEKRRKPLKEKRLRIKR